MKTARRLVQFGFLALTLVGVFVVRGDAERWCPFGGLEALHTYVTQGNLICSLGVSNFYLLAGLLVLTLLVRRAFCGYACPIGTLSEWLHLGARRLVRTASPSVARRLERGMPYRLDRALALLKYPVLALILYLTWRAGELIFRGFDPCYALLSRHGTDITLWAYLVSGGLALASFALLLPFCRWLCPLAAVFTPFSRFGLARIQRDRGTCTACGTCARKCPMGIRVDQAAQVTAARCTSCLDCVVACPQHAEGTLRWGLPQRKAAPGLSAGAPAVAAARPRASSFVRSPSAIIVVVLLLCVGGAVAATYAWPLPSFVHTRGKVPASATVVRLKVSGVNCRHSAEQFVAYLGRDDEYKVRGYLRIEAWPDPTAAAVRITYDPTQTDEAAIKRAITEPQFVPAAKRWQFSPYGIEGYDPLEIGA